MKRAILVVLAAGSVAVGQTNSIPNGNGTTTTTLDGTKTLQPVDPTAPRVVSQSFDQIVIRDSGGKVVRLGGFLDVLAMRMAPEIDDATWTKAAPLIDEWVYDTDRSVIDNLDFVEALDGGVLDTLNLMDQASNRRMMEMVMQFVAIGPLASYLEMKGGLTRAQGQLVTNIANEYHQQIMNEINEATKKQVAGLPEDEQQNKIVHASSRFIFKLMARDALASYDRQLDALAPRFDAVVAGVKPDAKAAAAIKAASAAIKAADSPEDTRAAVKKGLAALTFDQRRAVLDASYKQMPKFNARTAYQAEVDEIRAAKAK